MRIGQALVWVVGGLIGISAVALLTLWLVVNPNDYGPRIVAAVQRATGRDLVLQGAPKFAVLPWIALQVGPGSLANPPAFGAQPFLSFTQATVRVRLLPLLARRLDVARIDIDGMDLRLLRNAQGEGNWQGFGGSPLAPPDAPPRPAAAPPRQPLPANEPLQRIAGIRLTHARVSYGAITLRNIDLQTGSFEGRGEVPVTLHLEADRGVPDEQASLDARFDLRADSTAERLGLAAMGITSELSLAGRQRQVRATVAAPTADLNIAARTLTVRTLNVDIAGARLTGSLQGTRLGDDPTLAGTATLSPLELREFLPRLGLTAPSTRDPKALSQLSGSGRFAYRNGTVRVEELAAAIDDTHIGGSIAYGEAAPGDSRDPADASLGGGTANENAAPARTPQAAEDSHDAASPRGPAGSIAGSQRHLGFALQVDRIDLDRYLPLVTAAEPGQPAKPAISAETSGRAPPPANSTQEPLSASLAGISAETSRPSLSSPGISAEAPRPGSPANSAETSGPVPPPTARGALDPATGGPDAGGSGTRLSADGTATVATVHFANLDFSQVKLKLATRDAVTHIFPLTAQAEGGQFYGDITVDDRSGPLVVSLDEHLRGIDMGRLLARGSSQLRLTGRGNVNLEATAHGAGTAAWLETLDGHVDASVSNGAVEGFDLGYELGRAGAWLEQSGGPAAPNTHRTAFETLEMSAQISRGVVLTRNLLMASAALKITGQGNANMSTQALDFALLADMTILGDVPIRIPVKVTGTISDPEVRPDVEALAKGELKQRLEQVLKDRLKGLFGNP